MPREPGATLLGCQQHCPVFPFVLDFALNRLVLLALMQYFVFALQHDTLPDPLRELTSTSSALDATDGLKLRSRMKSLTHGQAAA